jgi:hypothetical protein
MSIHRPGVSVKRILPLVCLSLSLLTSACSQNDFASAQQASRSYLITVDESESTGTSDSIDPTGTQAHELPIKEAPEADDDAATACAKLTGVPSEKIKVSGSLSDIKLSNNQPLALKVTGNKNLVTLDLTKQAPTTLVKAICIFIAGNQNSIKLDVALHIQSIFVTARGNQSKVEINTKQNSTIDHIDMDAKGNRSLMEISGAGSYPCEGSNSAIICEKKTPDTTAPAKTNL